MIEFRLIPIRNAKIVGVKTMKLSFIAETIG